MNDRQLARKLILLVLLKLVLLFGLWWLFFRDQNVVVSSESMAHVIQTNNTQSTETGDTRHGR